MYFLPRSRCRGRLQQERCCSRRLISRQRSSADNSFTLVTPRQGGTRPAAILSSAIVLVLVSVGVSVSVGPSLASFDLNMNDGTLSLTFDTAVSNRKADIDWTGVSLRTHVNGQEGWGVTLWSTEGQPGWGEAISSDSDHTLTVDLHPSDLDEMQASHVGHNSSYAWITLRKGTFVALDGGERSSPVYGTQVVGHKGMGVGSLVQDSTRVSVAGRELLLIFSEGVDVSAFDPSELHIFTSETPHLESETVKSFSMECSTAARGRGGSYREIVLRLHQPCDRDNSTVESAETADGIGFFEDSTVVPSYSASSVSSVSPTDGVSLGGYASHWDLMVDLGVFPSEAEKVDDRSTIIFKINATSAFVTDLSSARNALTAVENLYESFPDCQPCGNGTFRSEPCTDVYDATCAVCTEACFGDTFALSPCTAETDLDCHRCTQCPFGTREIGACELDSDRICEVCTECGEGEYESRACSTGGDDRICESCLRCTMSPAVVVACRDSPIVLPWQMEHCCETSEGERLRCIDVPWENLRISAREGHRHWVFERSIPPVKGYSQDYWGMGAVARDGVAPPDEFIDVEFRPGAKSVFDDPRYLGQEGPSLGGEGT